MATDFDDVYREAGADAVKRALDAAAWPDDRAPEPTLDTETSDIALTATPFTWRDPTTIPRRQFLYGFELRRGQLSATIAPGAAGKTTYKVGRAICMAAGRDLLGRRVWNGPHRIWLWNLEDEVEEVEKTVHAFLKLWDMSPADLGDRLFIDGVDSVGSRMLKIGVADKTLGHVIRKPVVTALVDELKAKGIDHLDVDPFVSSHSVEENDNGAIDAVAKEWVSVAQQTKAAVSLTHHVRKPNGGEPSAHDARGASAMVNAARSVLVFQRMTKEVAQQFQVAECDRKRFFSVYDDKNNKAPPAMASDWYEFVSVGLGNGDDTGPEDSIGALQRWEAPNAFEGMSARKLRYVQERIDRHPDKARKSMRSPLWVGKIVGEALDLDPDDDGEKQVIKKMILTWIDNGALRIVKRRDDTRQEREYVEVREWAIVD